MEKTTSMKRFLQVLELYPFCKDYWYQENGEYRVDIDRINENIGVFSHQEKHIVKWLVGVFTGENILGFDLIECVGSLDRQHIEVICEWVINPYYP